MEKYHVINHENDIEYIILTSDTDKGTLIQLFASDSVKAWSEGHRGHLRMSALDTGNDLQLGDRMGKTLDYIEVFELHILIAFSRRGDTMKYPNKIVKAETILTL